MVTVLDELGVLVRTRPGVHASVVEVAAWYGRKAAMLRHVAAGGGPDADRAAVWAEQAAAHAVALVADLPRWGQGAVFVESLASDSPRRRASGSAGPVGSQPNRPRQMAA